MRPHFTALVLAAGKGRRMGSAVEKQFLELGGRPLIAYTLDAFEQSDAVDEIILVTEEARIAYCRTEIVEKYGYAKVSRIVAGGAERYDSVYRGLLSCENADYVYIHDGARIFITDEILKRGREAVLLHGTAVAGMPAKDTVKIADETGLVTATPDRSKVWIIQTPQIFRYDIVREAYDALQRSEKTGITDDATVVEQFGSPGKNTVYLYPADYRNIKITTPEDLEIAAAWMKTSI